MTYTQLLLTDIAVIQSAVHKPEPVSLSPLTRPLSITSLQGLSRSPPYKASLDHLHFVIACNK